MSFTEKVILITGAGSGIGAATAIHFSKLGAKLSLVDCDVEGLNKTAQECEKTAGLKPLEICGNMTNENDVVAMIETTIKKYSALDVLVNNAGIYLLGGIETTSLEQYDQTMNVNLRGVFQITMLATPHLIKSGGCIVNVSSAAGLRPIPSSLVYSISKAGVNLLTKSVAQELGPKGVRVNAVNPGMVTTNLLIRQGMKEAHYEAIMERSKGVHPLRKNGKPEDVAEAIAFLASNAASNITGTTLSIDGGYNIAAPR